MSGHVKVLDAGDDETVGTLSWPVPKKRQGTKSREVPGSERYGDRMSAVISMMDDASTRRRTCPHAGEARRVQWASRRARGVHQRAVGGLMNGIGSRRGRPHGRMLPQLSRFGVNIAKRGFNVLGMCIFK